MEVNGTLHDAVRSQDIEEFRITVDEYSGHVDVINEYLETPLLSVCRTKYNSVMEQLMYAKVLVEKHANISGIIRELYKAPVMCAYDCCNINLLQYFLKNVTEFEVAKLVEIFQYEYDDFQRKNDFIEERKYEEDRYLNDFTYIVRNDSLFYKKFLIFYNALLFAEKEERLSGDNLLVDANADESKLALFVATFCNNYKIVKFLLDSGIDVTDDKFLGNKIEFSVLHLAFNRYNRAHKRDPLLNTVNILFLFGANLNKLNQRRLSPMFHCVMMNLLNYRIIGSYLRVQELLGIKCNEADLDAYKYFLVMPCKTEISELKNFKLQHNFSLYYVLVQDIAILARNLESNTFLFHGLTVRDIDERYHFFGKLIAMKIILACERYKLIFAARPFLDSLNKGITDLLHIDNFPFLALSKIEDYLSNKDLYILRYKNSNVRLCCKASSENNCIVHAKLQKKRTIDYLY